MSALALLPPGPSSSTDGAGVDGESLLKQSWLFRPIRIDLNLLLD